MTNWNPTFIDRSNIVGEWLLDGDATDTGGSNNGTATNITWVNSSRGYTSEVADFNGTSSDITTAYDFSGTSSISMWLYEDGATGSFHQIYDNDSSATTRYLCYFRRSTNTFEVYAGGTLILDADASALDYIPQNEWVHIVITQSSGDNALYIDGVSRFTSTTTWSGTGANLTFGKRYSSTDYYSGQMGLIRVYDAILSQTEIDDLYQEGLRLLGPTNRANLSQGFPFYSLPNLENGKILEISKAQSGGVYYDQTGNGNNGTPTSVTDTALGKYNVMSFNGSTSKIYISPGVGITTNTEGTIITTVDTTYSGSFNIFFSICEASSAQKFIRMYFDSSGYIRYDFRNNTGSFGINFFRERTSHTFNDGKKHRVALTSDGGDGEYAIYVDGVKQSKVLVGGSPSNKWINDISGIDRIGIGVLASSSPAYYNGNISTNTKYFDKILTDTEIQQDYYSSKII